MTEPTELPSDEEVLQLGRRRRPLVASLLVVGAGVIVATAAIATHHRAHERSAQPVPPTSSATQPLAANALVSANSEGIGTGDIVGGDATRFTASLSVVNSSPDTVTPVYPVVVTLNGRPWSAVRITGLYPDRGPDPTFATAATPQVQTIRRGQVVDLVVRFDMSCKDATAANSAPIIHIALKGLRGTADFNLDEVPGGWASLRKQACAPTHG